MAFERENDNLARTIQLAEEFFNTRDDPEQISVTEEIMASLRTFHPATPTEETTERGPSIEEDGRRKACRSSGQRVRIAAAEEVRNMTGRCS